MLGPTFNFDIETVKIEPFGTNLGLILKLIPISALEMKFWGKRRNRVITLAASSPNSSYNVERKRFVFFPNLI